MSEMNQEELIRFLIRAKQETYAAQGDDGTRQPLVPGSKQLEYGEGPWLYRDIYFGFSHFSGQEVVYDRECPIWSMTYSGGTAPDIKDSRRIREVYAFLRAALRKLQPDRPFRGPCLFREGAFRYEDESVGGVDQFHGRERITEEGRVIYSLTYQGGWIR